jgi:hypothetical protein
MGTNEIEKLAHGRDYEYRKAIFTHLAEQDKALQKILTAVSGDTPMGTTGLVKRMEAVEKEQAASRDRNNRLMGAWLLITTIATGAASWWAGHGK